MTETKSIKKGNFFLAGIIGALAGAVGGLLLAPQSGKKTRHEISLIAQKIADQFKTSALDSKKRVEEVFGEVTDAAKEKYERIQTALTAKVAAVKQAGKEMDKDRYSSIVDQVIADFKADFTATKDGAKKMADQLKKDWSKVKKALT